MTRVIIKSASTRRELCLRWWQHVRKYVHVAGAYTYIRTCRHTRLTWLVLTSILEAAPFLGSCRLGVIGPHLLRADIFGQPFLTSTYRPQRERAMGEGLSKKGEGQGSNGLGTNREVEGGACVKAEPNVVATSHPGAPSGPRHLETENRPGLLRISLRSPPVSCSDGRNETDGSGWVSCSLSGW